MADCFEDAPYNIVLLMTDDQRFDTLWALPELNARSEPTRFENAMVTTPLCCPTRTSILTGFYPVETGIRSNEMPDGGAMMFDGAPTLATRLQAQGYRTALIGKYLNQYDSLAPTIHPGWSLFIGSTDTSTWTPFRTIVGHSGSRETIGKSVTFEEYVTEVQTSEAIQFLEDAPHKPFFLFVSYLAPHHPHQPAPQDLGLYPDYQYRERAYGEEDRADKPTWVKSTHDLDDPAALDTTIRESLQTLAAVDRSITEISAALERLNLDQRTVVIFMSDNGQHWGEHQLYGKGSPYDESIRVPLLIWGPQTTAWTYPGLVSTDVDVSATIQELTGLEASGSGSSLTPILCGENPILHESLVLQHWRGEAGVWSGLLTQNYKYIEYGTGEQELYDRALDPYELTSLHRDPSYGSILSPLADQLHTQQSLSLLDTPLPNATLGQPYQTTIPTWGGTPPLLFALRNSELPPGLSLDPQGTLTGTPTLTGNFSFEIIAQDSSSSPYNGKPQSSILPYQILVSNEVTDAPTHCGCGTNSPRSWVSVSTMLTLFLALTLTSRPVFAQSVELMPAQSGYQGRSTTVSTKGTDISVDAFIATILDASTYPKTATYFGVPALLECRSLGKLADGTVIVYQRTGGNSLLQSRHYVIGMKVTKKTDTSAEIQWYLVKHTQNADGSFTGPYADTLNAHKSDAVYTPYNHGTWRYDKAAGTITYACESDAGGSIPSWAVSDSAVMAFPLELMRVKWGIQ